MSYNKDPNYKEHWYILALVMVLALVMIVVEPTKADTRNLTTEQVCNKLSNQWVNRTKVFSNVSIESSHRNRDITYCVMRVTEQKMDYTTPSLLKLTYNNTTGMLIVKRWGVNYANW